MNKQEIISLSVKIVNKEGLQALTMARLARDFKVKPPSVYKHIRNIHDVYDELGIICLEALIRLIQENVFGLSGDAAVFELARSFRKYGKKNPGLYQAMQLTHVKRSARFQKSAAALMGLLSRLIASYHVTGENQVHAIRLFRCILHGFIDLEIQQGFGLEQNLEKSFTMAIHGFISALKNNYKKELV